LVVVVHLQRAEVLGAEVGGADRVGGTTEAALQAADEGVRHRRSSSHPLNPGRARAGSGKEPEVCIVQGSAPPAGGRQRQRRRGVALTRSYLSRLLLTGQEAG